ncbi:unnamed protein product [Effrenium voratum]|uniref:Uncharacterized protein n=1 Tax=Effrenium voratum TaxID=2562239 RepID=A0AA36J670_9DINO|nr:unnamed protein product [Effrenium voratum]CAJ1449089.1 unnamed protein product [Effrenium voratum]
MLLHRLRRAADSSFEEKASPPYIGPPCELPVVDPEDPICVEPRRRRERRERCARQKKSGFRFTCSCCCCAVGLLVICAFAITGRLIISHTLESRTSWHRPESSGVNDSENDTDSNVTAVPSMANSSAAEGAPVSTGDAPLNATSQNFLEAPSDVDVNVTESNGTGLPDSVSNDTAAPSVNTSMANSSAAEGEPVATNDAPHNATSQNLSEAAPSDVGVNFTESNGTGLTDSTSSDTDAATSVNASVANSSAAEVAPVTDDEPDNATSQNLSESLSDVGVNVTESNGTSPFSPASNTTEAAQGVTVSVTDSTTGAAELSDVYYGYDAGT